MPPPERCTEIVSPVIAALADELRVPGQTRNAYEAYDCELSRGPALPREACCVPGAVGRAERGAAAWCGAGPAVAVRAGLVGGEPAASERGVSTACRADQPCTASAMPPTATTASTASPRGPTRSPATRTAITTSRRQR